MIAPRVVRTNRGAGTGDKAPTRAYCTTTDRPVPARRPQRAHARTEVQKEIVRADLRHTKRRLIAQQLCISPNTITAYRTSIRKKFLALPEEQRPVWVQAWLRHFPGAAHTPHARQAREASG
ncbi:MAG TPA: hypothetical protein VFS21_02065 [Roseiflexaceae bacterium]|nr:hypothetical protein [Roseiflexaceae bacterium]